MVAPAHYLAGDTWSETFDGKTRKDGLSLIAAGTDGQVFSIVISSGNGLIKTTEGWKSFDEFVAALAQKRKSFGGGPPLAGLPARAAGPDSAALRITRSMNDFHTPAETVQNAARSIQNIRQADGGYLCDVPVPATPAQLETQTIRFWIKDGLLTKFEIHDSGKGYEMGFESTDTMDISNVGSTAVELPGDAKVKWDSINSQGKAASPAGGG
jgi:hypothetical protein